MIKAVVDKLEDVDAKYHDLYTEKNGKFELTGVEGMKTDADVARLSTALEKERKDHKEAKNKFAILGDRKPDEILAQLERIPELEAAASGKIDDDKINKIVESRIVSKTAPLERTITQLNAKLGEKDTLITGFTAERTQRTLHDAVRDAFGKAKGIQPTALEDALAQADRMFTVTEDNKVITKDGVGVTPGIDAGVWLTEMQTKRPHWWGPTQGGGAGGNGGGGPGHGTNPWSHAGWNKTEQGAIFKANRTQADQLAKSAGTTVSGPRPAPQK